MSAEEQALGFAHMNRVQKTISTLALYWASVAGGEPEYVAIAALMERVGVRVMTHNVPTISLPNMSTTAIGAIRKLVNRFGTTTVEEALLTMTEAWPTEIGVFSFQMIKAVEYMIRVEKVEREAMVKVLRKEPPFKFISDAKELSGQGRLRVSTALIDVLSKQLKKKS